MEVTAENTEIMRQAGKQPGIYIYDALEFYEDRFGKIAKTKPSLELTIFMSAWAFNSTFDFFSAAFIDASSKVAEQLKYIAESVSGLSRDD